jgi:predicted patatin/cPLA2 family phospholipase
VAANTHLRITLRFIVAGFICIAGCVAPLRKYDPPPDFTRQRLVNLDAPPGAYAQMDPGHVRQVLSQITQPAPPLNGPQYNILVLSGGGMYGAFSAGVLVGWTKAGTRPKFDCVTGVSTGALIAILAFLGPEYDDKLQTFATTTTSDRIYTRRRPLSILWQNSLASPEPLQQLINGVVDMNLLHAVAKAHTEGRRLFVGTTNLDTRRPVVWDMGEIATRGDDQALALFRKVLLASCTIPGFFPPVSFDVEVDGKKYSELHVDGGASASLFLRLPELKISEAIEAGRRPLAGSNLYIIVAGKLYADADSVRPRVVAIAGSSLTSLIYSQARGDLYHLFTGSLVTGLKYQMVAIPQDFPVKADSTLFDPAEMKRLFDKGSELGRSPSPWRNTPPGPEDMETSTPRAGVHFSTKVPAVPPSPSPMN